MTSRGWNYADVLEAVADRFPEAPAAVHGDLTLTWKQFDERADGLARALLDAGLGRQDKVAQYLCNCPQYLESMFAAFKVAMVPVNTNFRYGDEELAYLWRDSDTAAVVFGAEFTDSCDRLRRRLPQMRAWIRVGDAAGCPDWAIPYETAVGGWRGRPAAAPDGASAQASADGHVQGPWGRSGDDLNLLYTGGTTGLPKGVMWPQHDFFLMIESQYGRTPPEEADVAGYVGRLGQPGPLVLPAPPLMHGTACWYSLASLTIAGGVVTLTGTRLDPVELLDTIVDRRVKGLCIVGDSFARPMLDQLEAQPGRWDLGRLRLIMSSGAMLSRQSKERLLALAPSARIVDGLGSSESGTLGTAVSTTDEMPATSRFVLGPNVRVIDEDGRDVEPGSGHQGRLAVGGHLPLGYYNDPEKTAATFLTLDGRRHVVAGDWATVDTDGTITLLGRGSGCINTAGEKVYPEEIEEVLKTAAGVSDAAVVGFPDERYGEVVVAIVALLTGCVLDEDGLIAHAKSRLAGYKAPRRVVFAPSIARHANGKMDYPAMRELARSALGG